MNHKNKRNRKQRQAKFLGGSFKAIGEWRRMIHHWWNKDMTDKKEAK
jgi:hypothetical protein